MFGYEVLDFAGIAALVMASVCIALGVTRLKLCDFYSVTNKHSFLFLMDSSVVSFVKYLQCGLKKSNLAVFLLFTSQATMVLRFIFSSKVFLIRNFN